MTSYRPQLETACRAASLAGDHLRAHFSGKLIVDELSAHDVKLRIDKECQQIIRNTLADDWPAYSFLGEEGGCGGEVEWIVDPLDGTVNYYYGIPLFCVSIALRVHGVTQLGCVYAPMVGEMFTALRGEPALLNGQSIHVSSRDRMERAIVFIGHGSHDQSGEEGIRRFAHLSARVCKIRILGTAALTLCYVAAGRMDAYVENSIHLWDFAAAQLILESAGGDFRYTPRANDPLTGSVIAWNGRIPLLSVLDQI